MDTTDLNDLRLALLILINAGVIFRVGYCYFQMIHDNDGEIYKKRIRYAVIFSVMANSLIAFKDIIVSYIS